MWWDKHATKSALRGQVRTSWLGIQSSYDWVPADCFNLLTTHRASDPLRSDHYFPQPQFGLHILHPLPRLTRSSLSIQPYIHSYIHICIHTYMDSCTHTCIHSTNMHSYMHSYTHNAFIAHTCIHTHMHSYIHACVHTYTHTYMLHSILSHTSSSLLTY